VPSFSYVCLLNVWLSSCFSPVPMGWDLLWSLTCDRSISVAPFPASSYPSSCSVSLSSLSLHLSVLFFPGPFFISWELGFLEVVFLPALPLLLLLFPTMPR
jgi:hypothetical protein